MRLDPAVQQLIWLNLAGVPARLVHHPGAVHGSAMPPAPGSPPPRGKREAVAALRAAHCSHVGAAAGARASTASGVAHARQCFLRPLRAGGSTWVPQWCETDTSSKNSFPPATSCSRMIPRPAA
jgi:hypothetical protein